MSVTNVVKRSLFAAFILGAFAAVQFTGIDNAFAGKYYTGIVKGVAVGGYDPVAYFKAGKAVKGSVEIETEWDGVKWRFSSAENRDAFLQSPQSFKPQYGGYCAYAVAHGRTAKGDPRNWKVVGSKLYLNYNSSIQKKWQKNQSRYITKANKNWPKLN